MKSQRVLILIAIVAALGLAQSASAQCIPEEEFHGISLVKLAQGQTPIGQPYLARYRITNSEDTAGDTLEVTSLSDTVFASGGNVVSGNILATLTWTYSGGAYWDGINNKIILPAGGQAVSNYHSFYTVVAGDFNLLNHKLNDQVTIGWKDLCNGCSNNCAGIPETATASGSTTIIGPPCVKVTKTVDCDVATVGKEVIYTYLIENCGPNPLTLVSIVDDVLGDLSSEAAGCTSLAVDANCSFSVPYTIQPGDDDPLENTVDVNYVDAYGQHTTYSDDASVNIIHPNFTVVKDCNTNPINGPTAIFDVTITNTGDVPLRFTTNEAAQSNVTEPFDLIAGATKNLVITKPSDCASDPDVNNVIRVTANLTPNGIVCPIPNIVKSSNNAVCYCVPTIEVDKEADCDVAKPGKVIVYTITITNTGGTTLTLVSVNDSLLGSLTATAQANGCSTLAAGAHCSFMVKRSILPGDPDPLDNTVTALYVDSIKQEATDNASARVNVIHPDFTVTKTCLTDPIPMDSNVALFDVAIENTGDVNLVFTTNEAAMSSLAEPFTVGAGMTQHLTITKPFIGEDVNNVIIVTANLVDDINCPIPNIVKESNPAVCSAPGGATRTPGFWKNHCIYAEHVFEVHCGGSFNLGFTEVNDINDLLGYLFANPAQNTDGSKRADLCKARIKAVYQAIPALLNNCLENGGTLPKTPAEIAAILAGTNISAINNLHNMLDEYNNSGDWVEIIESHDVDIYVSTPQDCAARADIAGADCITPTIITVPSAPRRR